MRLYLPPSSFIGYLRRWECSTMPCSRTEAPLAQCAPRLSGESNTGSWRTQTPSCTTASTEQPTEQCVHTVRFTSVLPGFAAWACASPMKLSGSWLANAAVPAAMPDPFRKARRSTVFAASEDMARASGLRCSARPSDFLVSSMAVLLDLRRLVVLADVLGIAITGGRVVRGRTLRTLHPSGGRSHGRGSTCRAQARCKQEVPAAVRL